MKSYPHIFTPLKIGKVTVRNRIESSPAIPFLAAMDYSVTRELIEWNKALARGGAGVVTIGETPLDYEDARSHGRVNTLCLATDAAINGLSVLAESIHRYGAVPSIELGYGGLHTPTEMTEEQIAATIAQFADAAKRCMLAGMEMIMVHGGHGHLVGQFFSPVTNGRTDRYGGNPKKRAQFAIEILDAIRRKVGDRLAIEYRISADELVPGAPSVEETIEFAKTIEDRIDLLHVSAGNLYAPETCGRMIQPTYVPRGINVGYAARFKEKLSIPITTVGSLTIEMAEEILAQGKADMVAMIRSIIADPDCVKKAKSGRADTIRPCVRCNRCLSVSRDYTRPTRCSVNPVAGRESEFVSPPAAERRKKVVVIGGGPGGMEAARTAAHRGHHVVLFERSPRLGGALIQACALPFKDDLRKYLEWAQRSTHATGNIDIRLSTEATAESVSKEQPDVVIIAVGGIPVAPPALAGNGTKAVWAGEIGADISGLGNNVLVVGAGQMGCEAAIHLAMNGRKVTVIDMLPPDQIGTDVHPLNMMTLSGMLQEYRVEVRTGIKLDRITATGAVLSDGSGNSEEIPCDTIVFSMGITPDAKMAEKFGDLAPEVHIVGDCRKERGNLHHATTDGFDAAIEV
jgi:2,4-dienoyl-CoA reductase-like NADH-dependent reductase (Old Yellow Enzyme family)/thioredoxin reductase